MAASRRWTEQGIPALSGKSVIVTGANSGLGLQAARMFAAAGAHVVLACRNADRALAAMLHIKQRHARASVESMLLDLADLGSVRAFAASFCRSYDRLHVLLNNAGVMALPYATTRDGFEMQLGTNHLGHFALTGLLIERMLQTPGARVVTVSSMAHRLGKIRFDDLNWRSGYRRWPAYHQSKLANLLFTLEMERRLRQRGADAMAVACHPGYAATNLQLVAPRMLGSRLQEGIMAFGNRYLAQSATMGALSFLYAAVAPEVRGGDFIGPAVADTWGYPARARTAARARDHQDAARLWEVSEQFTGVDYRALER
jgi:NAD(P)-dependent dehydrogenase (short-subunit alcohol dehydrogenase family)